MRDRLPPEVRPAFEELLAKDRVAGQPKKPSPLHPPMPDTSKRDRILQGLRELCAEQKLGQTFTDIEIAQRCGCSDRNIAQIGVKAMERLKHRLKSLANEFDLPVSFREAA